MPANVYECMFLLDTNKVAGDVAEATKQIHAILEKNQAEILASRPWDERRLAYSIKRGGTTHKKGLYYLTYFRTDSQKIVGIEHDCALSEMIMRLLIIRVEPKLVDAMLAMARDEHAVHLQTVTAPPPEEEEGVGGGMDEDRPRRGPRRMAEVKED